MGVEFSKVAAGKAADICAHTHLSPDSLKLLNREATPREFTDAMIANKQFLDVIDFLCHALPPREAIWWGCLCLQHACGERLSQKERSAAKAAAVWVMRPNEETRSLAKSPGEQAGYGSVAGALAIAASLTGGSLAPPNYPPVRPSPFAPAQAVVQAIKSAVQKGDPQRRDDLNRCYAELGLAIAEGKFT